MTESPWCQLFVSFTVLLGLSFSIVEADAGDWVGAAMLGWAAVLLAGFAALGFSAYYKAHA